MPEFQQVATVCFKIEDKELRYLLIKTTSQRWVIPKTTLAKEEFLER
jgi:hypothetical protein